ncbi:MAG: hypothetical protein HOA08_11230 [Rhodospirillaceae bacterium]|jgi:hypothetical protein|nr:hypothetical protein [Rhodospirillaceae bacterium]MBT3491083.1 hypothetical protein [Rhodospirillaceae bacterium]MBT3781821.1 hypothetical protein [Rhodospirillaceae bacterium]MBT3975314.1 hypothetical protein [Rhodospirillaceae bacterium]MBT4167673.1 hypothetical protein [Rhodospirillaceae bacterium]
MTSFSRISFDPVFPWWLLAVLFMAAAILLAVAYWRRSGGTTWRLLALAAVLLALANPSLVREQRNPIPDVALIVVDQSISQRIGERQQQTEAALARIEQKLRGRPNLEMRVVRAGLAGAARETGAGHLLPDGTHLFGAIRRALRDVPDRRVAGIIIISDGQVHDLPSLSKDTKSVVDLGGSDPAGPNSAGPNSAGPVHLLLSGQRGERDRRLVVVKAPSYGIVGEVLNLTLRAEDSQDSEGAEGGGAQAGRTGLRLRRDGGTTDSRTIAIGQTRSFPFRLNHGGATVLELEIDAGPDELTLKNNRAVLVINGVRERLRVLLVSGEPHAGERTWRNILKSDPSVDLVHFTILRPPHKQDGTPINELSLIAFPTRELFQDKLDDFDLIIFDRYRRRGVLPNIYLQNVAEYVRRGGAVLTAVGPDFASPASLSRTPLGRILPSRPTGNVREIGFRPLPTGKGRRHPVTATLSGIGAEDTAPSWGRWFRQIDVDGVKGDILLRGAARQPLLITARVGDGRVAQLLSDHAWLWTRGFEGGGPQAELLRRIAHWLMQEPDLEEEDLRARANGSQLLIQRRSLSLDNADIQVTTPSGEVHGVRLKDNGRGVETGSLVVVEPGLYRLADGSHKAIAAVGDMNPLEYADMRASPKKFQPLLEHSGGGAFWLADGMPDIRRVKPDRISRGRGWLGLRASGDYTVSGVEQTPLLPGLLVLLLFLGLTMLAWHREGR